MKIDGAQAIDVAMSYHSLQQMGMYGDVNLDKMDPKNVKQMLANNWKPDDLQNLMQQLNVSQNKFFIIRLMKRGDVISILHLLNKDQLVNAMQLFPKSMLMRFITHLPKEMMVKMLLHVMPLEQMLAMFKSKNLFAIMYDKRQDERQIAKTMELSPPEVLQNLMSVITGQDMSGMKQPELLAMLRDCKKESIVEGMKSMPEKDFREFALHAIQQDPQLLMAVPTGQYIDLIAGMPKPNIVELFRHIDEENLVKFLTNLPDKFMALAASQIDDKTFMYLLGGQFSDVLMQFAAA